MSWSSPSSGRHSNLMGKLITVLACMVLIICAGQAFALQAQSGEKPSFPPPNGPAIPTVTFTMSLPRANPPYYSVTVSSMGRISYYSQPSSDLRTGEPYMVDFTGSKATRTTIFCLAEQLNFFQGNFKTRHSTRARTGWKSLTFAEGPINNRISYTSSNNPLINRLTTLFERISATMEFGRRVGLIETNNRCGLSAELKRMKRQATRGQLTEVEVIAPELQHIASDLRLSESSRDRAQSILDKIHS